MGFRFRRSFKLMPGVRINLSKSGVSTSVGTRGSWFTIGPRGTRATVGIPGTGLSYTEQSSAPRHVDPVADVPATLPSFDLGRGPYESRRSNIAVRMILLLAVLCLIAASVLMFAGR